MVVNADRSDAQVVTEEAPRGVAAALVPEAAVAALRRIRSRVTDTTLFASVSLVVFLALLVRNRWVFSRVVYEYGDEALNSIQVRQGKAFELLVGHYSRVGFHHPGPAFLYVQTLGEVLFYDLIPVAAAPFDAQQITLLALNAVIFGLIARIVWRNTGSLAFALMAVVIPVVYLGYRSTSIGVNPLASTWMPYLFMAPTLLLLVSMASISTGRTRDLPTAVFAGLLLMHGHVSFIIIVSGITAVAVAVPFVRRFRTKAPQWERAPRRVVVISAVIAAVFLLPIVVNLALHWPGEFGKYLKYSTSSKAGGHSLGQSVMYTVDYWWHGDHPVYALVVIAAAAVLCAVTFPDRAIRRYVVGAVIVGLAATAMMLYYAISGVDEIDQIYIGQWSSMVEPLMLWVIAARVWVAVGTTRPAATRIVAVVASAAAVIAVLALPQAVNPYKGFPQTPRVLAKLEKFSADRPVLIDVGPDIGPNVPGIVLQAARTGHRVCLLDPAQALFVTTDFVCTAKDREQGVTVYAREPQNTEPSSPSTIGVLDVTRFSSSP
ncbi:hypothetical protein KGQ20_12860 [Catenulispora sp. NF23]|uniref:hypothetical protein n=1 Tax=Catenulispora pinistramenti TaxID=2705254 RepID=UPI001BA53AE5|nr:hypothetical protein [Catenulispora pinistramenti]MBS2533662.1 hypothetical protein [Catenulispora pinistramenti]